MISPERSRQLLIAFIFAIAVFFSLFHLKESPSVWFDEGIYMQTATNLADGLGATFQLAPGRLSDIMFSYSVGYPVIYPLAILFKIFGSSVLIARSMMVFFILTFAVSVYFVVRRRFGPTLALYSFALVATFPPLYGNGKSVLGEVPALLFLTLSFICFQWAQSASSEKRLKIPIILAGLFAGIAAAAKLSFLPFLAAFVVGLIVAWRRDRLPKSDFLLTVVFSALPVAVWLFTQYYSADSWQNIFSFFVNPFGTISLLDLARTNLVNLLTETTAIYLVLMMIVWTMAVIIRWHRKEAIAPEEIMAYAFSVLTLLAYLRIVGWLRYLFPAQMVAMIYFMPSLNICVQWLNGKLGDWPKITAVTGRVGLKVSCVVLSLFGIYGLLFNSWVASSYQSRKTSFWEQYFKEAPADTSFFFYDVPEVAMFSSNRNYYQHLTLQPVGVFGDEWLEKISEGEVDRIIVRTDTLQGRQEFFLEHYYPEQKAYKYTILHKNP